MSLATKTLARHESSRSVLFGDSDTFSGAGKSTMAHSTLGNFVKTPCIGIKTCGKLTLGHLKNEQQCQKVKLNDYIGMNEIYKYMRALPDLRGTLAEDAPLGEESWFRCGGRADLLFQPCDFDDLACFLKHYPRDKPLTILGGMANVIVRDGGVRGCVIRLGRAMSAIEVHGGIIIAAAGALNGSVASAAAKAGIGGLEFLSGIPGTVGGALRMNAGAYGAAVKDIFVEATALDRLCALHKLEPKDMGFAYRHISAPAEFIFTQAIFRGKADDIKIVRERLKEIKRRRGETQPISEKTGGSTFANPMPEDLRAAGLPEDMRAWQIVEKVGGRGLEIGGAQMSRQHCNFMINTGEACAADLEALGDELRRRARDQLGLDLHWEIKRIGDELTSGQGSSA